MKTLLLLRHAKSSWKEAGATDHQRPLNGRGRRDAPRMGALIGELGLAPQRIVTSTARRARETAAAVAEALGFDAPLDQLDDLYHASPSTILGVAAMLPDDVRCALLVGHNPGMEASASAMANEPIMMATATLVALDIDLDRWRDLDTFGTARALTTLRGVWRPKEID